MSFKIRIFQPIVPEYRVALFNGLGKRYAGRIDICAAEAMGKDSSFPLSDMAYDYTHSFRRIGPFLWQKGLSLKGLSKGDVIVVCGDIHQLSSLWIALKAKLRGIKVVWWGHHTTAYANERKVGLRLWIARRLSDIYLCYTRTGISYLEKRGFVHGKVFATGNTIDQEPIKHAMCNYDGKDMFGGHPGILCCSVLREKVKLDLAIRALADDKLKDVRLAVIGDGPKRDDYTRIAEEMGVADRIVWVGATRNQKQMAPWFLSAKAFVYPGAVGLSILHSMSYGLPVVVHGNVEHQMPEYEIMEDGRTGLCFHEDDVGDLAAKLDKIINDGELRCRMSLCCRALAYEKYSMNQMVANFSEAIEVAAKL